MTDYIIETERGVIHVYKNDGKHRVVGICKGSVVIKEYPEDLERKLFEALKGKKVRIHG